EWAAEYEFIVDSLLEHPGSPDAVAEAVDPYLEQLDRLVAAMDDHPILVRIGGLREATLRAVKRWQQQLVDGVLHTIVRDMIERLEYYFDPLIHTLDGSAAGAGSGVVAAARVPTPPQAPAGAGGGRRSSVSRHQRNLSAASAGSQTSHGNVHQRSGSVLSNTWSGAPGDRGTPRNSISSVAAAAAAAAAAAQSPLTVNTQPNARGLAHARAVSSAFEALGSSPAIGGGGGDWASDASLSPSLGPFGIAGAQRLSRASTVTHPASRSLAQSTISGARAGVLRRTHRQHSHVRTPSSVRAEAAAEDDGSRPLPQQPLRQSLSTHRGVPRRYRP
ncbi:hypothetical protein IWQ56_007490, partial [Coemansia nantahalensis]